MGDACCHNKSEELEKVAAKQTRVLWIVLAINAVMFAVELSSGLISKSLALTGDSLDMAGDAMTYATSIYVVGKAMSAKASVARLKALIMLVSGALVVFQALGRFLNPADPNVAIMTGIGILALGMNLICLVLLSKHKTDDINFSSVWICSRNDIIANTSVIFAAGIVALTASRWPDLVVGLGLAVLFTRSAWTIYTESKAPAIFAQS